MHKLYHCAKYLQININMHQVLEVRALNLLSNYLNTVCSSTTGAHLKRCFEQFKMFFFHKAEAAPVKAHLAPQIVAIISMHIDKPCICTNYTRLVWMWCPVKYDSPS